MTTLARWTLLRLILLLAFFSPLPTKVRCLPGEARLVRDMLRDYAAESRPVKNSSHIVQVNITLTLNHIISLDEKRETFTSVVWIGQQWMDAFLTWNTSDYDGTDILFLAADRIWTPDLYLYNLVGESHNMAGMFTGTDREMLVLLPTGHIINMMPVKIETMCQVDLTWFPFDTQTCRITLGSWVYSEAQLVYYLGDAPSNEVDHEGAWKVVHLTSSRTAYDFEALGTSYTFIHFDLKMKRNPLFYILNLIIPSYLMNGVMVMSFFLPPECGERMSVGLTVFMAYSVFSLIISDIVPASAHTPPIMCILFISNMLLTLVTIGWTVFVIRVHNCASSWSKPPPPWLLRFLCFRDSQAGIHSCCTPLNNLDLRWKRPQQRRSSPSKPSGEHGIDRGKYQSEFGSPQSPLAGNGHELREGSVTTTESAEIGGGGGGNREQHTQPNNGNDILVRWKVVTTKADRIFAIMYLLTSLIAMLVMFINL